MVLSVIPVVIVWFAFLKFLGSLHCCGRGGGEAVVELQMWDITAELEACGGGDGVVMLIIYLFILKYK